MVEIDLAYCHFLIKESSRKNNASGTRIPESFFLWKKMFGRPEREMERAAIYTLLAADEIRSQEFLLNQSPSLIEKYDSAFWLLEWKLLVDCYKEVYEVENSLLVLSEPQKKARINEIVEKTARLFFDDGNRLLFQRRLEEIAFIFWESGQKEDAKAAFAAALAFAPDGTPADKHPFALQTVIKNFSFLKEQSQKEKRSESGRIVLP
jgi:tetratricopeptide (TPR) repeat protein